MDINKINKKEFKSGYEIIISYLNNVSNNLIEQIDLSAIPEKEIVEMLDSKIKDKTGLNIKSLQSNEIVRYIEALEEIEKSYFPKGVTKINEQLTELIDYSPYLKKPKIEIKTIIDLKQTLKRNNYSLLDILDVSPFDNIKNLNGNLTSEIFFNNLFIQSPKIEELEGEINEMISSRIYDKNFLFLTGMAGTGKTTFLNYFIKNNKQYKHDYYNCELYSPVVKFSDSHKTETVFASIFKRKLFEIDEDKILPAFNYIISNKHFLFRYLPDLYNKFETFYVKRAVIKREDNSFLSLIYSFDDYEIAILYFLIKVFNKVATDEENIPEILYFDNLDSFPQRLLNDSLLDFFPNLYVSLINIVKSSNLIFNRVDFAKKYKFIFCLRSQNLSYLNTHTFDRTISNTINKKLSIIHSSKELKKIIEARLELYNSTVDTDNQNRIKEIYSAFSKIIDLDWIIGNIQSIFNFDYRKIITFLIEETSNILPYLSHENNNLAIKNIVANNISRKLKLSSILRKYSSEDLNYYSKYCNVERILLTVLFNLSKTNNEKNIAEVPFVEAVKFFSNSELIDKKLSLEVLSEMLYKYKFEQINFISINDSNFEYNEGLQLELKDWFSDLRKGKKDVFSERSLGRLESMFISIYPSAYSYVRTFSINYEFYSVLVGNSCSLYEMRKFKSKSITKEIKNHIRNVINLVKEEIIYLDNIFQMSQNQIKIKNYEFEIGFALESREVKFSHITRVIISHLGYLDNYRLYILQSSLDPQSKAKIETLLLDTIKEYAYLLEKKQSLRDEKKFIDYIVKQVLKLKKGGKLIITTPNNA